AFRLAGPDHPAYLRQKQKFISRPLAKSVPDPPLAQPVTIEGCGIEIAASVGPGRGQPRGGGTAADRSQQIAQRRGAETHRAAPQGGLADSTSIHGRAHSIYYTSISAHRDANGPTFKRGLRDWKDLRMRAADYTL